MPWAERQAEIEVTLRTDDLAPLSSESRLCWDGDQTRNRKGIDMFKQSRLLALFILPLGLIVMTQSGFAQKKVSLEIGNVSKNESLAKKSPDGKSRLVPISFELIEISEVKTGSFK